MQLIAHRGFAALAPENSLAAFAIAAGIDDCAGVELDVRLTADIQLVVHNDAFLNPAFCKKSDSGYIKTGKALSEYTLAELKQFEIGELNPLLIKDYPYSARKNVPNQSIPTLRQTLTLLAKRRPGFIVIIELKFPILKKPYQYQLIINALKSAIQPFMSTLRLKLCSFDWRLLRYAKMHGIKLPLFFTTHPLTELNLTISGNLKSLPTNSIYFQKLQNVIAQGPIDWWRGLNLQGKTPQQILKSLASQIKKLGGQYWFIHVSDVTSELMQICHQLSLEVAVWGGQPEDYPLIALSGLKPKIWCSDKPIDAGFGH